MKNCKLLIALVVVPMLVTVASAATISSCTLNVGPGFTCDLYDSLADGTPSDISNVITLPNTVGAGDVAFFRQGVIGDPNNPATWSDVLEFTTTTVQLFTLDCNVGPGDTSCFPAPGAIGLFVNETDPVTVYTSGPNTYNVHESDAVPEPATLALTGLGLIGVGFIARKRRK